MSLLQSLRCSEALIHIFTHYWHTPLNKFVSYIANTCPIAMLQYSTYMLKMKIECDNCNKFGIAKMCVHVVTGVVNDLKLPKLLL